MRDELSSTSDKISYNPVRDATCHTCNVVYGIICMRGDSIVYIGERERVLHERMGEHLRDVHFCREKPINSHFGEKGHGPEYLAFAVFEKVCGAEHIERQLREALWIKRLATARPDGCNVKDVHIPAQGSGNSEI